MATLRTAQQLHYIVHNKAKQITKTSYKNEHSRSRHTKQPENQLHSSYYCYQYKQCKEYVKNDCDKSVEGFYHIESYYQPIIITHPTKSNTTQSQRTSFFYLYNNYKSSTTNHILTRTAATVLSYALHSLHSNNGHNFVKMLLLTYLLLVQYTMAAPQSCILCDKNDLQAKDPQRNYEEFLFEHQVTRQDAINALRQLNESFYEGTASDGSCNGVRCTEKVMKYCLGPQFINDHCWCEVGHSTEGLPFVPHICYVGEKIYKTSVGSCFFYEEVKDCCCSSLLAKEWRHISAGSSVYSQTLLLYHNSYVLAAFCVLCLVIRLSIV